MTTTNMVKTKAITWGDIREGDILSVRPNVHGEVLKFEIRPHGKFLFLYLRETNAETGEVIFECITRGYSTKEQVGLIDRPRRY